MSRPLSLPIAAVLVALTLAHGARAGGRDPAPTLFRHYSPLARVERRPAPKMGWEVQRWILVSARGDTAFALWRPASKRTAHPWTAVLIGGFDTGDRSALLVPDDTLFNTLGVNWPWRGKRRLTPTEFALQLPAIQRAVLRSPSVLALGVEAAARTRGVDPERIVVVGASLGVPTALAALRLTSIPKALVLLDGGADLELMMRAGLEHEGWLSAAAAITAAGAYQWVWPLEPMLNAPAAAQVPVLVMNSTDDERVPRAAALKLQASLPHATVHWRSGPHVLPSAKDVIWRLTHEVDVWLRASDAPAKAASAPRTRASLSEPH